MWPTSQKKSLIKAASDLYLSIYLYIYLALCKSVCFLCYLLKSAILDNFVKTWCTYLLELYKICALEQDWLLPNIIRLLFIPLLNHTASLFIFIHFFQHVILLHFYFFHIFFICRMNNIFLNQYKFRLTRNIFVSELDVTPNRCGAFS